NTNRGFIGRSNCCCKVVDLWSNIEQFGCQTPGGLVGRFNVTNDLDHLGGDPHSDSLSPSRSLGPSLGFVSWFLSSGFILAFALGFVGGTAMLVAIIVLATIVLLGGQTGFWCLTFSSF